LSLWALGISPLPGGPEKPNTYKKFLSHLATRGFRYISEWGPKAKKSKKDRALEFQARSGTFGLVEKGKVVFKKFLNYGILNRQSY
jgi:hypothetical protein